MNELLMNICISLIQHYVRTILLMPLLAFPILYISYRCIEYFRQKYIQRDHKPDMINADIASYIDSYLEMNTPGFSVFINGGWGSGKTYFIRQYERNSRSHKKSCYVSLFGISSKKEFEFALWKGILCSNFCVCCTLLWSLLSITISIGFILYDLESFASIDFWSFFIPIVASIIFASWCFAKLKLRDVMLKNRYLILDDFERAEVDYPILMAWISELVEHRCCPVIIIGNEQEIIRELNSDNKAEQSNSDKNTEEKWQTPLVDSFVCEQYKRMREKVIGREFLLTQNDAMVVAALNDRLPQNSSLRKILKENIQWFVTVLFEPLHKNGILTNYRALEHVMHNFEWHFFEMKKYIEDEQIWKELIPRYFSLMYYRDVYELQGLGCFDEKKILYPEPILLAEDVSTNKNVFQSIYPFWKDLFLSPTMWGNILDNNTNFTSELSNFLDSYLHPDVPSYYSWDHFYRLDDNELNMLIRDTNKMLEEHSLHSPEDILRWAKSILEFQATFPEYVGLSGIKDRLVDYISKERLSCEFANYVSTPISHTDILDEIRHISTYPAQDDFEEIKSCIIEAIDFSYKSSMRKMFSDFVTHIADEKCNFRKWYYEHNLKYTDLYSGNSPKELWDSLREVPTRLFVERMEILRGHIISVVIEKSNPEIQFWEDFIKHAMATRDQWERENKNYCKQFKIKQFAEMVGSRFKSLVGSEENNAAAEARDV